MNIFKTISKTLSLRLSLMVVLAIALLLAVSMVVMLFFSRQVLKSEAMRNAELTLDGTDQQIDIILLSVEQSTGNVYWDLTTHLDKPEIMNDYCRRVVEGNPYIVGCAIVFQPYYYPERELSMYYVHRKNFRLNSEEMVTQETFAEKPYTEQVWYTMPMKTGRANWTPPLKNEETEGEEIISFCLPIYDKSMTPIGVLAADVPIELISNLVLSAKPSQNAYSTLLSHNGSYIVHPDSTKLNHHTVYDLIELGADHSLIEAAEAMLAGESGMKPLRIDGKRWYVFYKPFKRTEVPGRAMERLDWSVGVVYPENDIFGDYNSLLTYVIVIGIISLLVFFGIYRYVTHRQLKPLQMLTQTAQHIADGNYKETIHETHREDEIGQLQQHFGQMQQSLAKQVSELEQLSRTFEERGEVLKEAYSQAQQANRVKTAFLHNMTNQMIKPAETIEKSVTTLCQNYKDINLEEATCEVETIEQQGEAIIGLINHMIKTAENNPTIKGKEDGHE